jgi:predicted transcriptional regulator
LEQAEKFRALKALVAEGMADVEAGRVTEWDFEDFLRKARASRRK